jgi:hypothetical protein
MKRESMSDQEMIERLKEARKLLHKEKGYRNVEECMPVYKEILAVAGRGELNVDPLKYGGMVSDLQNAGYLTRRLTLTK